MAVPFRHDADVTGTLVTSTSSLNQTRTPIPAAIARTPRTIAMTKRAEVNPEDKDEAGEAAVAVVIGGGGCPSVEGPSSKGSDSPSPRSILDGAEGSVEGGDSVSFRYLKNENFYLGKGSRVI